MTESVVPLLQHLISRRNVVVAELRHIDELLGVYLTPYAPPPAQRTTPEEPAPVQQSAPAIVRPVMVPATPKRQYSPETLERMRQTAASMRARKAAKHAPQSVAPGREEITPEPASEAAFPTSEPVQEITSAPAVDLSPLAAIATPRKAMTPAEFAAKRMAEKHQAPMAPAPQPATRMEALMAVSKAVDAKPRRPAPLDPVFADFSFVARWAGERGIAFKEWDDLPKVNTKREALGLPTFKRSFPTKGVRG
ncbi:MAG: hypothetical protein P4L90_25975 [Rhodopila sp.]|nr:hypothetical protein [Rhodopila sp.]